MKTQAEIFEQFVVGDSTKLHEKGTRALPHVCKLYIVDQEGHVWDISARVESTHYKNTELWVVSFSDRSEVHIWRDNETFNLIGAIT